MCTTLEISYSLRDKERIILYFFKIQNHLVNIIFFLLRLKRSVLPGSS